MKCKLVFLLSMCLASSAFSQQILWDITAKSNEKILFKNNFYSPYELQSFPVISSAYNEDNLSNTTDESNIKKKEIKFNKYELSSTYEKNLRLTTLNLTDVYMGAALKDGATIVAKGDEKTVTFIHACNSEESIVSVDSVQFFIKCKSIKAGR